MASFLSAAKPRVTLRNYRVWTRTASSSGFAVPPPPPGLPPVVGVVQVMPDAPTHIANTLPAGRCQQQGPNDQPSAASRSHGQQQVPLDPAVTCGPATSSTACFPPPPPPPVGTPRTGTLEDGPAAQDQYSRLLHVLPTNQEPEDVAPQRKELNVGAKLRVEWSGGWWAARVSEEALEKVKVSFDTWSDKYDEWIPKDSPRLRLAGLCERGAEHHMNRTLPEPKEKDQFAFLDRVPSTAKVFTPKPFNPEKEFLKRQLRLKEKIASMQRAKFGEADRSLYQPSTGTGPPLPRSAEEVTVAVAADIPPPPNLAPFPPPPPPSPPRGHAVQHCDDTLPSVAKELASLAARGPCSQPPSAESAVEAAWAAVDVQPPRRALKDGEAASDPASPLMSAESGTDHTAFAIAAATTPVTLSHCVMSVEERSQKAPADWIGRERAVLQTPEEVFPPGVRWQEVLTSSKERYYHEIATDKTQRELPTEGWVELVTDEGDRYYWDPVSNTIQWTPPTS